MAFQNKRTVCALLRGVKICVTIGVITGVMMALLPSAVFATPPQNEDVIPRRGKPLAGTGTVQPTISLDKPVGGWTSFPQVEIAGKCSDDTADPIEVSINGTRYLIRGTKGTFSRAFPVAPGQNAISASCRNQAGMAQVSRKLFAKIPPIPLKVVLTSDTDGVYTDLHIYEPDGTHVYWADTVSPSGGIFYLNQQGDDYDQPGFGPYLYVHPAPPVGVFRIDANYWPGGAKRHTLANLDVITQEGTSEEKRVRVRVPLARPDETRTFAYVIFRANRQPIEVFSPNPDEGSQIVPPEVLEYRKNVEPKMKQERGDTSDEAFLSPVDESALRQAIVNVGLFQTQRLSPLWEVSQRDCAGFVRFLFREALQERTAAQRSFLGIPSRLPFPALSTAARAAVPQYPRLWQTKNQPNGESRYGFFADAESLLAYNFRPKGKDLREAKPADLLVFEKQDVANQPFHLMFFAGSRADRHGREDLVLYHNGAAGAEAAVRVVSINELLTSADPTWIPRSDNPNFRGVFEWKKIRPQAEPTTESGIL